MLDGDQFYGPRRPDIPADKAAQRAPLLYWSVPGPIPNLDTALAAGPGTALNVYANHGRWIVSCPTCQGSQLASRTDPRFFCTDCGNVEVEGRWRDIVWPVAVERISQALDLRPIPATRNWLPHETPEDIETENLVRRVTRDESSTPVRQPSVRDPMIRKSVGLGVSRETDGSEPINTGRSR